MNSKNRSSLMAGIIYLAVFLAYNLAIFLIFDNFNAIFWVSYVFMLIAFAIHIACTFFVFKDRSVEAAFFGIPLMSFSLYFLIAEFFCSLVFMIFRGVVSMKVAVLIQALLLILFIVIAAISILGRDAVVDYDKKVKQDVAFIKNLNVDVEMLIQRSKDPGMTAVLKKLSETIKYSDPASNDSVAVQEQMIMQYMPQLRMSFDEGDAAAVTDICEKLELLFVERNKKLMISK